MKSKSSTPLPDLIAQAHSNQLLQLIKQNIIDAGGMISFANYMQTCLYQPGLGYYNAGSHKLGKNGDFITAPEISPLFAQTLCRHILDAFDQLPQKQILEFGAGSGQMACDILLELENLKSLPDQYLIIEISADLQKRQLQILQQSVPHLIEHVVWITELPKSFSGVILANEVCDAMPVNLLHFNQGKIFERHVGINANGNLSWVETECSSTQLKQRAKYIERLIKNDNYTTEVNLIAEAWISELGLMLKQGAIFILDYGYNQIDFYHPAKSDGSVRCFYQQLLSTDPFCLPGLQDITADVNFTALATAAHDNQLDVASFQTQADFLIAGGITQLALGVNADVFHNVKRGTALKQLIMPSGMGERFKVLTLTKNLEQILPKAQVGDKRYKL